MAYEKLMARALALAARGRGRTSPNPMVGAVLEKGGKVIAEDYHKKAGTPHAEALVLKKAGAEAAGSTLYVTLEPCCHTNKRTPPCTRSVIEAGVRKVIISSLDPNPQVSGRGVEEFKKAGIEVVVGPLGERSTALNEVYNKHIVTNTPFVIMKTAMTLDGKIATHKGQSKWITSEKARRLVHRTRGSVDAILTAIGTVEADDPELTARTRGAKSPLRVVIDPELRISPKAKILKSPPETVLVTKASGDTINNIIKTGCKIINYNGKLELSWLMKELGSMGVTSVLIEGGSSLNAHALNDRVVDKVMFFIAPKILGGSECYPSVGGPSIRDMEESFRIRDMSVRRVGEDVLIEGRVLYPEK